MIEAYNPDYVFVFSWIDIEDDFLKGTDFLCQNEWFEDSFRSVFTSKQYNTKLIWTSHPNRYSFLQTSVEEMCTYLADTYKKLSKS